MLSVGHHLTACPAAAEGEDAADSEGGGTSAAGEDGQIDQQTRDIFFLLHPARTDVLFQEIVHFPPESPGLCTKYSSSQL